MIGNKAKQSNEAQIKNRGAIWQLLLHLPLVLKKRVLANYVARPSQRSIEIKYSVQKNVLIPIGKLIELNIYAIDTILISSSTSSNKEICYG